MLKYSEALFISHLNTDGSKHLNSNIGDHLDILFIPGGKTIVLENMQLKNQKNGIIKSKAVLKDSEAE